MNIRNENRTLREKETGKGWEGQREKRKGQKEGRRKEGWREGGREAGWREEACWLRTHLAPSCPRSIVSRRTTNGGSPIFPLAVGRRGQGLIRAVIPPPPRKVWSSMAVGNQLGLLLWQPSPTKRIPKLPTTPHMLPKGKLFLNFPVED